MADNFNNWTWVNGISSHEDFNQKISNALDYYNNVRHLWEFESTRKPINIVSDSLYYTYITPFKEEEVNLDDWL